MRLLTIKRAELVRWLAGAAMILFGLGVFCGRMTQRAAQAGDAFSQPAAAVMASVADAPETDAPVLALPAAPTPVPADAFTVQVLSQAQQETPKRVLIYHTHTYEAFEMTKDAQYRQTQQWRTKDNDHNVVRVGKELAALLTACGVQVTHDVTAFEPPTLSTAYARSLNMLEKRIDSGETYDLIIDLHRDAYSQGVPGGNTASAGGQTMARLMFLVGKGTGQTGAGFSDKPDWGYHLTVAQSLQDALNDQVNGLCKPTSVKSGRYNQHAARGCLLIEVGNNKNTLAQALTAMPYLAQAICRYFDQSGR